MGPAARDDVGAVAALDDPVRRALYRHVAARAEGVNRDQAAGAVKISRPVSYTHLASWLSADSDVFCVDGVMADSLYGRNSEERDIPSDGARCEDQVSRRPMHRTTRLL